MKKLIKWTVIIVILGVIGAMFSDEPYTTSDTSVETDKVVTTSDTSLETDKVASAKAAEKVRKGFHCLSAWDGSHSQTVAVIKKNLKDPKSFEHIETKITPVNSEGFHMVFTKYRAKNSYGGFVVEEQISGIKQADCSIIDVE